MKNILTIAAIIFFLLFAGSLIRYGIHRADYLEEIALIKIKNDSLKSIIDFRMKEIKAFRDSIDKLSDTLIVLNNENKRIRGRVGVLEEEKRKARIDAEKMSSDSSYAFLDKQAYPYDGEKKYLFNEPQIKEMHLSYIDNIAYSEILSETNNLVDNLTGQLTLKDSQIEQLEKSLILHAENAKSYEEIILNKEEEAQLYKEESKKDKRKALFWKIAGGVGIGLGILIAL